MHGVSSLGGAVNDWEVYAEKLNFTVRWLKERISGGPLRCSRMRNNNALTGSTSDEARLTPVSTARE